MSSPLIVLKFGGSVLRDEDDLYAATHEVYSWVRRGWKVVAVVSAFEGETDRLVAQAHRYGDAPTPEARALLTGTGELNSASMLALALDRSGIGATVAAPWTVGLRAEGDPLDAFPVGIDQAAFERLLGEHDAVVVPGFIGLDERDRLVLLGRGGSDLSALFLADRLRALKCRLVKDVDGLYEHDPAAAGGGRGGRAAPRRYATLPWSEAIKLDGGIVQHKAIRFAAERRVRFEVGAILRSDPTLVGDHPLAFASASGGATRPLGVALLGCGTVGLGVHQLLTFWPERFRVVRVAVRDLEKAAAAGVERSLLTDDAVAAAADPDADIIVEALGGVEPATAGINAALRRGAVVVTANKAALAANAADPLWQEAIEDGRLRCSASVGGAAPVLEAIGRIRDRHEIVRIDGIINGTTNTVLELVAAGRPFGEAVSIAQRAGLAEADPSRDLEGLDVADKLAVLARLAWGVELDPERVRRIGLNAESLAAATAGAAATEVVKFVATLERTGEGEGGGGGAGVSARVAPIAIDAAHPLAQTRHEWNALIVTTRSPFQAGTHTVRGKGAGRWPTAEAVFADVLDAWLEARPEVRCAPAVREAALVA